MTSSSLLDSKYFDKLQVNRLKANDIKSNNIIPNGSVSPSYLFSAVFNNATFDRNETGGTLTVTKDGTESIIQFSERPFRQTENINFESFVSLFGTLITPGINSFQEDPPNGMLIHSEEQRTYIIKLLSTDLETATFILELLPGETHNLVDVNGRMSLFVDNSTEYTITKILYDNISTTSFKLSYNNKNYTIKKSKNFFYQLLYTYPNNNNDILVTLDKQQLLFNFNNKNHNKYNLKDNNYKINDSEITELKINKNFIIFTLKNNKTIDIYYR